MSNNYNEIVERFPKLFQKIIDKMPFPMFGFECGPGWYTLILTLCHNINSHTEWQRRTRANALRYNRALKRAQTGDWHALEYYYSKISNNNAKWVHDQIDRDLANPQMRPVPDRLNYIRIDQIKEKFGGLRFYYSGGDDIIDGMTRMAESMSYYICEICGDAGKTNRKGWIRARCELHQVE